MLYKFRGFHGCLSECDLEIVRSSSKTTLVICTELPDNPGTSVTNLAAELATGICEEHETIDPAALLWVEHYPPPSHARGPRPRILGVGDLYRAPRYDLPPPNLASLDARRNARNLGEP